MYNTFMVDVAKDFFEGILNSKFDEIKIMFAEATKSKLLTKYIGKSYLTINLSKDILIEKEMKKELKKLREFYKKNNYSSISDVFFTQIVCEYTMDIYFRSNYKLTENREPSLEARVSDLDLSTDLIKLMQILIIICMDKTQKHLLEMNPTTQYSESLLNWLMPYALLLERFESFKEIYKPMLKNYIRGEKSVLNGAKSWKDTEGIRRERTEWLMAEFHKLRKEKPNESFQWAYRQITHRIESTHYENLSISSIKTIILNQKKLDQEVGLIQL